MCVYVCMYVHTYCIRVSYVYVCTIMSIIHTYIHTYIFYGGALPLAPGSRMHVTHALCAYLLSVIVSTGNYGSISYTDFEMVVQMANGVA